MIDTRPARGFLPGFGPDGRTVIVALDHALASGQVPPLDRPAPLLAEVLEGEPDALILSAGMNRVASAASPPWWLTADYYATSVFPGVDGEEELHTFLWHAEQAIALGARGLKCLLVFGRHQAEPLADNVASIARLVAGARRAGVAVMIEATLWGSRIPAAAKDDPVMVAHAARVAFELGADVIKVPLPAGGVGLRTLTSALPVPIVVMGGPATDPATLFHALHRAIGAGAAGVAMGRNVWQHPHPAKMVRALNALVHEGAEPTAALAILGAA